MQCSNCNQDLLPDAEFCGNCGAKIANTTQNTQTINANNSINQNIQAQPTAALPISNNQQVANSQNSQQQAPQQVAPPSTNNLTPGQNSTMAIPKQPKKGLSIASLVIGIIALLSAIIWFISMPLGILAIVLGAVGIKKGGKGMAIAGIVTGSLGFVLASAILIIMLVFLQTASNLDLCKDYPTEKERQRCLQDQKNNYNSTQSLISPIKYLEINSFRFLN